MKSQNIKYFHQQPEKWEDECIKTRRNIPLRKHRLELFKLKTSDKILDLGCGDGLNTKILTGMGFHNIIGSDISQKLLRLAQSNNPDVTFVKASADKMPFADGEFNVVLADSVFHHLIYCHESFSEIHRVLKRGGFLCFSDPHRSIFRSFLDICTTSFFSSHIPYLKNRKEAYLAEKDLMENWLRNETNRLDMLTQNGFRKVFLRYDLLSVVGKYERL